MAKSYSGLVASCDDECLIDHLRLASSIMTQASVTMSEMDNGHGKGSKRVVEELLGPKSHTTVGTL